jgi:hypothetical protein
MNDTNRQTPDRFTVLLAGHRSDRLVSTVFPSFEQTLADILSVIRDSVGKGGCPLCLLTGVASGTDTLAADVAAGLGLPLELLAPGLPQPLAPNQARAGNVVWLGAPDIGASADEAIAIRDEIALGFADMLVVVWDGEVPHGLNGGTVRLALQAALEMIPTLWIAPGGAVRVLDRARLTARCRHRLRGPHPDPAWLRDVFDEAADRQALVAKIAAEVSLTLDPAEAAQAADGDDGHKVGACLRRLRRYLASPEKDRHPNRAGHLHDGMIALLSGNLKRAWSRRLATPKEAYWGPARPKGEHPVITPVRMEERFDTADVEASVAAGRHRDSTWFIYGASALAVFAAVAGAIRLWPGGHGALWAVTELVALVVIIGLFFKAKSAHWHEQWIGQRFIAEQVRYARMGLPVLAFPGVYRASPWKIGESGRLVLESPELWLIHRTLKRQGLPRAIDGAAYMPGAAAVLREVRDYVGAVVQDQAKYHHGNHEKLHHVHHGLHRLSIGLFIATTLAVPAHFLLHADWLLVFTAFFPALAAAIHGLATKLEIARLSSQHAATAHELAHIDVALRDVGCREGNDWQDWLRLRQLTLSAAAIMSDENGQWQQLISQQGAELPA